MPIPAIEFEFPFGADGGFFCPACGTELDEYTETGEVLRCPHLLFAHLFEILEFIHVDSSVEALTAEASSARSDEVDDVAFVAEGNEGPGSVVLQVTTDGGLVVQSGRRWRSAWN